MLNSIVEVARPEVIVLKSAGNRTFCAGASFDESIQIENIKSGIEFFSGFANVINACRKCTKIIIGRVQGKAVGGGVGIASAVDYCFATQHASVKLSELALGIGPFVVGPAVERKVGLSSMSALAINADKWFDANWGFKKGLYSEIFQDNESMDKAIDELAFKLSKSHSNCGNESIINLTGVSSDGTAQSFISQGIPGKGQTWPVNRMSKYDGS